MGKRQKYAWAVTVHLYMVVGGRDESVTKKNIHEVDFLPRNLKRSECNLSFEMKTTFKDKRSVKL